MPGTVSDFETKELIDRPGRSDWRERGVIRREAEIPISWISRVSEDIIGFEPYVLYRPMQIAEVVRIYNSS